MHPPNDKLLDLTMPEYRALPGINASSIKPGRVSMAHMHMAMTRDSTPTAAMQLGTVTHCAILEPAKLPGMVYEWSGRRGTNEHKQALAEHPDQLFVKSAKLAQVQRMADAVRSHKRASDLLAGCQYERSIQWYDKAYGTAKARLDAVCADYIVDVKTVANIEERAVLRQAMELGYDIGAGWYVEGCEQLGVTRWSPEFYLIYVESSAPYTVMVVRVGADVIEYGQRRAREIASRYYACSLLDVYPGPCDGSGDVLWELPTWAQDVYAAETLETGEASEL
jgi:hypothetical protein